MTEESDEYTKMSPGSKQKTGKRKEIEPTKGEEEEWIDEYHQKTLRVGYKVNKKLFDEKSHYQRVEVVETAAHGKMLFIDRKAMISERDEFVYHEMITHVPMFVHPCVKRVLVIGGGDGGTLGQVLRHSTVEYCHLVELDKVVLEACKKHFPVTEEVLGDYRVKVTVGDGVRFVEETDEKFDLVIVDSTDPVGAAAPLFGKEFYENVFKILNDDGVVISQAESPFYEMRWQKTLLMILKPLFARVAIYNYVNITYPGGLWSFTYASKGELCPLGDFDQKRFDLTKMELSYYSKDIHRAAFMLPVFQYDALKKYITPLKRS